MDGKVNDKESRCRWLLVATAAMALTACAGGGSPAPVVDRSAAGSAHAANAASSGGPRVSAGSEVGESDWTATVRPLGAPDTGITRALPGDAAGEPAPATQSVARSGTAARPVASDAASTKVNPAVVSLLNAASAHSRAGDHARAAATLERAIAIEPENAWLWHRLAKTRLAEGRLEQAASLAAKSSSLSSADPRMQADNWRIIAEVRRRQGDTGAAAAAEAQARRLAN